MRSVELILVTVLGLGTTAAATVQRGDEAAAFGAAAGVRVEREMPPVASRPADPADSLYRAARAELSRGNYGTAADLFGRIIAEHPDSEYAPDAYYWQAFALYRAGGDEQLKEAVRALETQREKHPNAATRGDAKSLQTRINGELARMGDGDAAVVVTRAADGVYIDSEGIGEAVGMAMEAAAMVAGPAMEAAMAAAGEGMRAAGAALSGMGISGEAMEIAAEGVSAMASGGGQDPCPEQAEENEMRVAALNALLQMDSDRALPILADVLKRRDECSAMLRRKAVFLVSQKRGPQTEDLLLDAARNDPDAEVRRQSVFWLSQVPSERALDAIIEILRETKDPKLQERAVFALSQHRDARAEEALRRFAGDESAPDKVREKAIFWLAEERGSPENAAFLRQLFERSSDQGLKERIIFSMSQMKGDESLSWLLDVAGDGRQPVPLRKKALFWAGESGAPIQGLVALYSQMPDREMREQLIFVYSQRKEPEALDKLVDIARTEPEMRLRKRAVFWLGESKDPRALQVLQEIINQ